VLCAMMALRTRIEEGKLGFPVCTRADSLLRLSCRRCSPAVLADDGCLWRPSRAQVDVNRLPCLTTSRSTRATRPQTRMVGRSSRRGCGWPSAPRAKRFSAANRQAWITRRRSGQRAAGGDLRRARAVPLRGRGPAKRAGTRRLKVERQTAAPPIRRVQPAL
jgi:hypothetical protein